MPAFQAINVEPEESFEDEIDTTRQLHIDEAFKRFQIALKLHAQGPRLFDEAADAYHDLFKSDIFRYPEAKTEYERADRPQRLTPESLYPAGIDLATGEVDNADSSLPQALYLAHKNRGQFTLDRIRHAARTAAVDTEDFYARVETRDEACDALVDFNAALDRDPADAELWRRIARVAAYLKSARLKRFCLEAAVELDDDPAVEEVEPPSLAEGLAGEDLKEHLKVLSDDVSLSHPVLGPWIKREILPAILRHLDPIPFLPNPLKDLPGHHVTIKDTAGDRISVRCPTAAWSDIGMGLVRLAVETGPSAQPITIEFPESEQHDDTVDTAEAIERQLNDTSQVDKDQASSPTDPSPTEEGRKTSIPEPEDVKKAAEASRKGRSESIATRKRSQSAAGLPEAVDEDALAEKRSKRTRRRETAAEDIVDRTVQYANQIAEFQAADRSLFQMTKDALENMGIGSHDVFHRLGEAIDSCEADDRASKLTMEASKDLRRSLQSFNADNAKILIHKKETNTLGMSAFLEHAKGSSLATSTFPVFVDTQGTLPFARRVNAQWAPAQQVAWEWVKAVAPSYLESTWSAEMKTAMVQVISRFDRDIMHAARFEVTHGGQSSGSLHDLAQITQMLFELHLDIYDRITNPNSAVDYATRVEARGRIGRWLDFASELLRHASPDSKELQARFLWAAVFSTTLTENASREYILQCWTSLRDFLTQGDIEPIRLQNNAVVPQISSRAADNEISKLTTMDFFLGLFQNDISDPVAVIDNLEPVLNPESVCVAHSTSDPQPPSTEPETSIESLASQGLQDLWKFVKGTSTELRLFLWTRLSDAYSAIKYSTKEFSCQLKAIEMVVADLDGEQYRKTPSETRCALLLRMLKSVDELLIHALSMALNDATAFDIVDEAHLRSTAASLATLSCCLHVAAIVDDEIRIGMTAPASNNSLYQQYTNKLREIQVRTWCLQYTILKAAANQFPSTPLKEAELADYLAATHQVLGLRKSCKSSNKIFLKMMRVELLKAKNIDNWEDYMGQVLYDLHGLRLGVGISELQDHGCPPEKLERRNTMQLAERVTGLARRMPMKDLLKSDLKTTIEHMQGAIGQVRSTPQMVHNLRNYNEFFKKPIHPLRLYQALRGGVDLDTVTVNAPEAALAKHGWFFLLGNIALSKYKFVDLSKRQTPGAMDDLRIGATFLRHQLQFTPHNWEVWFRLAECFDYEVEDAVVWSADKMNKERAELVKYQRNSIHCHTIALSQSMSADIADDDGDPLHDLYHNFAMRLYSSSREPFAMEPFKHSDHERFFIENFGTGTFQRTLHSEMSAFKVWKFAAGLFRRAIKRNPQDWRNPFMVSKCLWKMYQTPDTDLGTQDLPAKPSVDDLITSLERSIEVASASRKSKSSDPILEPHYKILSIVHKLVSRRDLTPREGATILVRQPFGIAVTDDNTLEDMDDWEEYVVTSLRHLRDKDKSNWQHRMIVRHARLLFDEQSESSADYVQAKAAFNVLRESMFTKTMVMNVWKCDAERPGRHHVFTEQYVRFVVKIIAVMKDRTNLEALMRRIRKKAAEFYHFSDLWQTCVATYLQLIRQAHKIPVSHEDSFKSTSAEEFDIMADRIAEWAANASLDLPAFLGMKEAIELKRLNGGLMKAGTIDDLISDAYTAIYLEIGPTLPGPPPSEVIGERNRPLLDEGAEQKPPSSLDHALNLAGATDSGANGEGDKQVETAPRRRTGVRRPDILRKAEQAYTRNLETPKIGHGSSLKSRKGSMSSGKRDSQTPNGAEGESDDDVEKDGDTEMKDPAAITGEVGITGNDTVVSSPAGSIHDSADDESDLSDLPDDWDEEPPPSLMFPNLARRSTGVAHSSSDEDDEGEGEEDEEGEEEEEDEQEGENAGDYDEMERDGDGDTVEHGDQTRSVIEGAEEADEDELADDNEEAADEVDEEQDHAEEDGNVTREVADTGDEEEEEEEEEAEEEDEDEHEELNDVNDDDEEMVDEGDHTAASGSP